MDPNVVLSEIRDLIQEYDRARDSHQADLKAASLVTRIRTLDVWLSNGGFLPAEWEQGSDNEPDTNGPNWGVR